MKYQHIARYVAETPWAIQLTKLVELLDVLAYRAAGHEFTAEEIQARIGAASSGAGATASGSVAVVPIRGVIAHRMGTMEESSGGTSCEAISGMLRQALASGAGTIVFDVDSPGGSVTGCAELAAEIFAAREGARIVAVTNGLNASAAFHLTSQAHEIVSITSGTTGSIGVFSAHQDLSKALEREGIKVTLISAGKYKVEGNPFEPLSPEAEAILQGRVDTAYAQFVKDVARGRGVSVADVRNGYGEGRALGAKDALKAGLIDRIDTLDATIGRLMGRKSSGGGMRAFNPGAALPEAERCATCKGGGLKPEKFMSDPDGQEPCPDCDGTGKARAAVSAPVLASTFDEDRARRRRLL